MAANRALARARVVLEADDRGLRKGLKDAETQTNRTARAMRTGLVAASGLAAGGLYAGAKAVQSFVAAAKESEISQRRMQTQLKALGISYQQHAKHIDTVIQKQSKLAALDDEDLQDSFTSLVRVTHNVNEALKLNALAADIARAKGIDLSSATSLVMKASLGSVGALKRQGIEIPKVTAAQDALRESHKKATVEQVKAAKAADDVATRQKAIAALQKTFGGAAESYGKSSAAAGERFHVALENLQETLGKALLPVLARVTNMLSVWVTRLSESKRLQDFVTQASHVMRAAFDGIAKWVRDNRETLMAIWTGIRNVLVNVLIPAVKLVFTEVLPRVMKVAGAELKLYVSAVRGLIRAFEFVKEQVAPFWAWLKTTALKAALNVVEPFSHLPGRFGKWARDAKDKFNAEIAQIHNKDVKVNVHLKVVNAQMNAKIGDGVASAVQNYADRNSSALISSSIGSFAGRAANPGGLAPGILDDLALGRTYGLSLSSGYRPGSITSTGNPSLHGVGRAIDMVGSESSMQAFFRAEMGRPGVVEAIHSPFWWHPGSGMTRIPPSAGTVLRDHYSHVHIGVSGDGVVGVGDGDVGAGPIARGRYALNGIEKKGPGQYYISTAWGEQRVPMQGYIAPFLNQWQGKGFSPAKRKAVAEWWGDNWNRIRRYGDGIVGVGDGRVGADPRSPGKKKAAPTGRVGEVQAGRADQRNAAIAAANARNAAAAAAAKARTTGKDWTQLPDAIKLKIARGRYSGNVRELAEGLLAADRYYANVLTTQKLTVDQRIAVMEADRSIRDEIAGMNQSTGSGVDVGGGDTGDAGGGGDLGGGSDGGVDSGPSQEEIEAQIRERVNANVIGFLGGTREVRGLASNILGRIYGGAAGLGPGIAGRSITVTIPQTFPTQPDPLTWAKGVEYEIRAAFGG